MSAFRSSRLLSTFRTSPVRSIQHSSRRTYAVHEPQRDTRTYHGGDQPPPAGSVEKEVPTRPSEVKNRGSVYAIGGVALTVGAFFAFLTGSPDRAAGVADQASRSGAPLISGPLSGKEGAEKNLEATTGRDPNRTTGLAG
ncbi:hypothetical protein CkaCkLH20_05197 [Colletotrichum karsti]|uniref:Uncharacterized protein n=1 Tax=Colletotrichum karsti TaxID=1095194 RepID=A0A9P6I5X1_9PEZI|nr:uncharacterized protein CkaCkLH20_05197 [Colletotrichum karsti]KAF9877497.1 hypothetical protein CkaCkLH20_05197 [Colletotrichum karsti]